MGGSNRGFIKSVIGGIRVGGDYEKNAVTFYPEHSKNGKNVSARCVVRGCINIPGYGDAPDMQVWKQFTFWRNQAYVAARSMSPGKEFTVISCEERPYMGQAYYYDPVTKKNMKVMITLADGVSIDLKVEKIGYSVREYVFGAESAKFIAQDIAAGNRSPGWDQEGTPANLAWKACLKARNELQYVPGMKRFGFANVVTEEGPGIGPYDYTKDAQQRRNTANTPGAATMAAAGFSAAPSMPATLEGQIQAAVNAVSPSVQGSLPAPATTQPGVVVVHNL
jgi:hypothetical protein